jgi:hypothetical protein
MAKKKVKPSTGDPPYEDARRCLALRKRSRSGSQNSPEESAFCESMWRQYPNWYQRTETEVFNDTVPFGSYVKRD